MNSLPVDPSLAMQEADQKDLIRRKMDMDALRKRLGDSRTQQQKLRESCEGFESIFIQKMWEQMRKNVPKEGYLHSKDEETYQSMFDVELSKKMASAGGIGLADMLYAQLSQQLEDTGRTTTPSTYRKPLNIPAEQPVAAAPAGDREDLKAENLYSPLSQDEGESEAEKTPDAVTRALQELRAELAGRESAAPAGSAAAEWAARREVNIGLPPVENVAAMSMPEVTPPLFATAGAQGNQAEPGAQASTAGKDTPRDAKELSGLLSTSWQGNNNISVKPKPVRLFGRNHNKPAAAKEKEAERPASPPRGMAPEGTVWPSEGKITSGFGWEENPSTGKRQWNSGVRIAAAPDAPVRACLDGTVIFSGPREGFGHTVVLEHADGFRSYYSNINSDGVAVGDTVPSGANFAKVAVQPSSSAQSAANGANSAQLYFEFKRGEMALNPESAIHRMQTAQR